MELEGLLVDDEGLILVEDLAEFVDGVVMADLEVVDKGLTVILIVDAVVGRLLEVATEATR